MSLNGKLYQSTIKCVFSPFTEVVCPIMNLISETYHFCERRKYKFNVLLEYDIIIRVSTRSSSL